MTSDVRNAVDRLRSHAAGEPVYPRVTKSGRTFTEEIDRRTLSDEFMAWHTPELELPIDDDWLDRVGFPLRLADSPARTRLFPGMRHGFVCPDRDGHGWAWVMGGRKITTLARRRHVVKLCGLLGVKLNGVRT